MIAAAVLLPHFLPLPLNTYSLIILAMVAIFLKIDKASLADLGFSFRRLNLHALGIGVLSGILLVAFLQLAFWPLMDQLIDFPEVEVELYQKLVGNTGFYIMMLIMAWLIGGVYEEIVFHGFIFFQFKKLFKFKHNVVISFLLTGILFGLYHLQLGPADTLNAFVAGLFYHFMALRFKGNLWYAVICHGTYNTIIITMLYLGFI